ncbi:DUF4913 domain-containing protein [Actinacidiphila glaucinigra]|uniref:DUF4913 domain-containing protein n=1 Tax=Actinacidiphila glaucinigra TaxID=235986 RepID=UPI0036A5375A
MAGSRESGAASPPDLAGMCEDIEDLKAQLAAVAARIAGAGNGAAAGSPAAAGEEADVVQDDDQAAPDDEGWQYPPFLLLLDPPEYDAELRALIEWVEGVLVPGYLEEPSADAHWCHLWVEHPVAIARLHALWLAWQELTDPAVCGYTGPSVWHRDHLDPCIRELRASTGPFQGCTKGEHRIVHRTPGMVPSAWSHPGD